MFVGLGTKCIKKECEATARMHQKIWYVLHPMEQISLCGTALQKAVPGRWQGDWNITPPASHRLAKQRLQCPCSFHFNWTWSPERNVSIFLPRKELAADQKMFWKEVKMGLVPVIKKTLGNEIPSSSCCIFACFVSFSFLSPICFGSFSILLPPGSGQ